MSERDLRAGQALAVGLQRFADKHALGLPPHDLGGAEFTAVAAVVFEDEGEWWWAVSASGDGADIETAGGSETTREAAREAARAAIAAY